MPENNNNWVSKVCRVLELALFVFLVCYILNCMLAGCQAVLNADADKARIEQAGKR